MKLWLSIVPDYAVSFCQLVLIQQIIASTSQPIIQAIHATGKIRFLSTFNGVLNILILPISYGLFKSSFLNPNICYIINALLTTIAVISNMCNLNSKIHFPLLGYLRKVIIPCYGSGICILLLLEYIGNLFGCIPFSRQNPPGGKIRCRCAARTPAPTSRPGYF